MAPSPCRSVNDWHDIHPLYENNQRRAFERLLRKLLKYPNKPAVVLVHAYCWYQVTGGNPPRWGLSQNLLPPTFLSSSTPTPSLSTELPAHGRLLEQH